MSVNTLKSVCNFLTRHDELNLCARLCGLWTSAFDFKKVCKLLTGYDDTVNMSIGKPFECQSTLSNVSARN